MMKTLNLQDWAEAIAPGKIQIHAGMFYPEILAELEAHQKVRRGNDLEKFKVDQYWLTVALEFAKRDVQFAVAGTEYQATAGGALNIIVKDECFVDDDPGKGKLYARKNYEKGRFGEEGVNVGEEARLLYKQIRQIPSI